MRYITETRNLFDYSKVNGLMNIYGTAMNADLIKDGNKFTVKRPVSYAATYLKNIFHLNAGTYTLSLLAYGTVSGGTSGLFGLVKVEDDYKVQVYNKYRKFWESSNDRQFLTMNIEEDGNYAVYAYGLTGSVNLDCTFWDIQLELGDKATDYVPYGYLPMYKGKYKVSNVCQLLDKSKFPATMTNAGVTFTNNGDGTITANGTATQDTLFHIFTAPYTKNHIILLIGCPSGGSSKTYCINTSYGNDYGNGIIKKNDRDITIGSIYIRIYANITVSNLTFKPQLFDLTEMYGAGNEPTTLDNFRIDFPENLYEYTPYCWAKINKFLINKGDIDRKNIYGVDKVGQSSPTLIRTDSSVGLNYTVGNSEIVSDFDSRFPWCEMKEVVDEYGNVFIRIPKFYTKITKNTDGTYKHQISGYCHEGFSTLFVDGKGNELNYVLVGKYEGSSVTSSDSNYDAQNQKVKSKSGQTVLTGVTRGTYRTRCRNVGIGYQQYDFLIDAIIKELFMIEFATTNSQSIMYGYTNLNSNAVKTGITDTIITSSGSPVSNTDGKHACKYRGIENPFGNVWKWCDGINFDTEKIYVCEEPEYYADDKYDAPYTYMGDRCSGQGYVKVITPLANNPLLGFVTELGADNNTYYSDYYQYAEVGTVLACGEAWYYGVRGGLWSWYCNRASSYIPEAIGGRLCYKPDKSQDYTARNWTKI